MKILAFDPGKNNFAFAFLDDGSLTTYGHVPTITSMQHERYAVESDTFIKAVRSLLDRRPDVLTFERMMHRPGLGGGAVVEYINVMIGIVLDAAYDRSMRVFPVAPVTWKSHWIKQYDVDKRRFSMTTQRMSIRQPAGSKTKTKTETVVGLLGDAGLTPHEGDAIGIAAYCWYRETGVDCLPKIRVLLGADGSKCSSDVRRLQTAP